jgi:hypothetical protein
MMADRPTPDDADETCSTFHDGVRSVVVGTCKHADGRVVPVEIDVMISPGLPSRRRRSDEKGK